MRGSPCRELNMEDVAATTARRPCLVMRWVRTAPFENRGHAVRVVARWLKEPAAELDQPPSRR